MKLPRPRKGGAAGPRPPQAGPEDARTSAPARRHFVQRPPPSRLIALDPFAGRGQAMAAAEPSGYAARVSTLGTRPGEAPGRVAGAAEPPSGRSDRRIPRLGERTAAALEKRGPYMVMRAPSFQAKLRECSPMGVSAWAGRRVPRARSGGPLGRLPRGTYNFLPPPKICSARVGSWRLGDTAEWGTPRSPGPFDFQRSTGTWPRLFCGEKACWGPRRTAPTLQGKGASRRHLLCVNSLQRRP